MENEKINLEENLETQISYYSQQKRLYNEILYEMDETQKEGESIEYGFKMFISKIIFGYTENKNAQDSYDVPFELNKKIFNLIHDFFEKQVRDLNEKRDNAIKNYMEQKKNIDDTMNKNIKFVVEQTIKAEKLFDKLENNK